MAHPARASIDAVLARRGMFDLWLSGDERQEVLRRSTAPALAILAIEVIGDRREVDRFHRLHRSVAVPDRPARRARFLQ